MAVIVKYVVERNGEKMTFTSKAKAEADAYDKMLDMADELFELLKRRFGYEEMKASKKNLQCT